MLVGLFEDLSIFLQIGEIAKAITELPRLIGQLAGNPSMLVALFVDMITAHMTRCMMVSPYGRPEGTMTQWANWVAELFFGGKPGGDDRSIVFGVACTAGSIVGYLVQQFLIGQGSRRSSGSRREVSKFASLGKKLADGAKAVKDSVGKVTKVAKSSAQKFTRAAGEAAERFMKRVGLKGDDAFEGLTRCVTRFGGSNSCDFPKIAKRFGADAETAARKMAAENPQGWTKFCKRLCSDSPNAGDAFQLKRTGHWIDNKPPGTKLAEVDGAADVVIKNADGSIWKTFDQKTSRDWSRLTDQMFRTELSKTWGHAKQAYGLTDKAQLVFEFAGQLPNRLKAILTNTGYAFVDGL